MLSRLQELRREEEALRRAGAALRDQLTRLRVEELALRAMMRGGEQSGAAGRAQQRLETLGQMDNEAAINQTELHLSLQTREEEEEEEEESDS